MTSGELEHHDPESPEDGEALPSDDGPRSEAVADGADDTGIDPGVVGSARLRGRRRDWVRIGFLRVPSGPFSCAVALLIHAALVAAVLAAAHWFYQPPQLAIDWGGGGGEVALTPSPSAPTPAAPGVPGTPAQPDDRLPHQTNAEAEPASADPAPFSDSRATADLADFQTPAEDGEPIIGIGLNAAGGRAPVFHREGGPAGAAGKHEPTEAAVSPAQTASASAVGTGGTAGGVTSHARLPGALLGAGIPSPDYPDESRRRGEQGVVRVAIEVLPDGSVGDIHVVSDPGFPLLRDAALKATQRLRRFSFTPASRFGQPVRDFVIIPYHFILQ